MAPKSDRSFPCFSWLSERSSEQGHEIPESPGSDYVFFNPATDFEQSNERSLNCTNQCGALPKALAGRSGDASDLLSRNQSVGMRMFWS